MSTREAGADETRDGDIMQKILMTIIRDDDHTWATDADNQVVAIVANRHYVNRDNAVTDVVQIAMENMKEARRG